MQEAASGLGTSAKVAGEHGNYWQVTVIMIGIFGSAQISFQTFRKLLYLLTIVLRVEGVRRAIHPASQAHNHLSHEEGRVGGQTCVSPHTQLRAACASSPWWWLWS